MRAWPGYVVCAVLAACGGGGSEGVDGASGADGASGGDGAAASWRVIHQDLRPALMSVWGSSASDVYAVGGDPDDTGPAVLHWDGSRWTALQTADTGDLWWVFGFAGGPVYMGGKNGRILRYEGGTFTPMTTPANGTVFGIWGASPTDVWAVGGAEGGASGAFAWRLSGDTWTEAPGFPAAVTENAVLWKVAGTAADDVVMVGTGGTAVTWDGDGFTTEDLGVGESLFTVAAQGDRVVAAGGFATGLVMERTASGWENRAPAGAGGMIGVSLDAGGGGIVVGSFGEVLESRGGTWESAPGPATEESLHAAWIDPDGGAWTVGGQVQAFPLIHGVLAYRGAMNVEGEIQ